MIVWIFVSAILLILVVVLLYLLNKKTREKEYWEKQEKRAWMLKIALEKSCELPTVEPQELEKIEPQINQMMNESTNDAELEEKMRVLIMSLYKEKQKGRGEKKGKGGKGKE